MKQEKVYSVPRATENYGYQTGIESEWSNNRKDEWPLPPSISSPVLNLDLAFRHSLNPIAETEAVKVQVEKCPVTETNTQRGQVIIRAAPDTVGRHSRIELCVRERNADHL